MNQVVLCVIYLVEEIDTHPMEKENDNTFLFHNNLQFLPDIPFSQILRYFILLFVALFNPLIFPHDDISGVDRV